LLGFAPLEVLAQGRRQTLFSPQGLIRHWTIRNPLQLLFGLPGPPDPDRDDSARLILIKSLSRSPDPDKCCDCLLCLLCPLRNR
jgi:hypothetical protein